MNRETFFKHFELLAEAPNAVAKMRELVLELAVQGQLVRQNTDDEPASELLKRVETEKGRRNGAHKFRVPQSSAASPNDHTYSPPGWVWVGATTPAILVSDQGKKVQTKDVLETGKYPVVDQGKVFVRGYCNDPEKVIRVTDPLVVFGDHTRETKLIDFDFVVGADGVKLLQPVCIDPKFYFLALCWVPLESRGYSRHFKHLRAAKIPLPPLAEQKRIVAKVDELMALCDELEAQQEKREKQHASLARASLARFAETPTSANLNLLLHRSYSISPDELRKTILTLAVRGRLVPLDLKDEPAEKTFPKLAAARIEPNADEFPAHWLRVPVGRLGEWRGGGTPSKSRPEFWDGTLPWVSPKDMKVLHISDAQDHISPAAVEGSSVRLIPAASLLMVVRGMILARAFPVALTTREVTINQDMKALLPCDPRIEDFLLTAFRAFEGKVLAAIEHSSHGTCKLKTELLHDFVMPIPPLAEQHRIVAKVDELMALVDQLEQQLTSSRITAEKLLNAIVAQLTKEKEGCDET